jgi:hypothetical protein
MYRRSHFRCVCVCVASMQLHGVSKHGPTDRHTHGRGLKKSFTPYWPHWYLLLHHPYVRPWACSPQSVNLTIFQKCFSLLRAVSRCSYLLGQAKHHSWCMVLPLSFVYAFVSCTLHWVSLPPRFLIWSILDFPITRLAQYTHFTRFSRFFCGISLVPAEVGKAVTMMSYNLMKCNAV